MGSRVLAVKAAVAVSMTGDRVTLLDLDRLELPPLVLEGSAASVWRAIDGVSSVDAICDDLADAYELPVSTISADVVALLEDLVGRGLLVEVGDSGSASDSGSDPGADG
ncbi:hypothetical protein GCM10028801_11720 [Nocardioides maradonensis]